MDAVALRASIALWQFLRRLLLQLSLLPPLFCAYIALWQSLRRLPLKLLLQHLLLACYRLALVSPAKQALSYSVLASRLLQQATTLTLMMLLLLLLLLSTG